MTFDDVITQLGAFGPYQRRLILLSLFPHLLYAFHLMIPVFILSEHKHRCKDDQTPYPDDSIWGSNTSLFSCQTQHFNNVTNTTYNLQCKSWYYDTSEHASSPISDFDLVCDDAVVRSHITMAVSFGMLVSTLFSGIFGDSCGRKPVVCITLAFLCFSIGCAFAPSPYVLAILRFLTGIGCNLGPLKLIVMEMVGPSWRYFAGLSHNITYKTGELILCGVAYFIRDWRTLQLVISVPCVVVLLYVILLPESIRWLHSHGKTKETHKSLRRMSNSNNVPLPDDILKTIDSGKTMKETTFSNELRQFFRSRKFICRWLIVVYLWFVIGFLFTGYSFNLDVIDGSIYVNFTLSVIVEIVALVLLVFVGNKIGRKTIHLTFFFATGILAGMTVICKISTSHSVGYWMSVLAAISGRICGGTGNGMIFTFASELFPTSLRTFVISTGCTVSMVGGMAGPYVGNLEELLRVDLNNLLPFIVFGTTSLLAGILCLLLPETLHKDLPQHLSDVLSKQTTRSTKLNVSSTHM